MVQVYETEQLIDEIEQELGRNLQKRVRQAFLQIPRHIFVEQYYQQRNNSFYWDLVPATMEQVYHDQPLVTQIDQQGRPVSSSSQPSAMAAQLEALDILDGHSILEIGAGTGYNAALMDALAGQKGSVISIDIDPVLVQTAKRHLAAEHTTNVHVLPGDGFVGCAAYAPYDRILATCAVQSIPRAWVDQLKPLGVLVCNLVTSLTSLFVRVEKNEAGELDGKLLDINASYMLMHTGTLPPKTSVDWQQYDSLPHTSVCLAENFETLLQNPAYSLLLHSFLPAVTRRYRSNTNQISLYLLTQDTAIKVNEEILTIYGNHERMKGQIKLSLDLYKKLNRPGISDYHIHIQERRVTLHIADHIFQLDL